MQRDPQGMDIGPCIGLCFAVLLGRGVSWREKPRRVVCLAEIEHASDAKVDQLDLTGAIDHDVAGFEVSKDDRRGTRMQVIQHITQLHSPHRNLRLGQRSTVSTLQDRLQRIAIHKVHHQVLLAAIGEYIGHFGQVRMLKSGQHPSLLLEPGHCRLLIRRSGICRITHLFDRHPAVHACIYRIIYGRHPASAHPRPDDIAADQHGIRRQHPCSPTSSLGRRCLPLCRGNRSRRARSKAAATFRAKTCSHSTRGATSGTIVAHAIPFRITRW